MTTTNLTKTCPTCGAAMPINLGFITWCDQCGYNLENTTETGEEKPKGMFPRLWNWMGKRSGEGLYKEACAMTDLRPRLTVSIVLAFLIALVVHGLTLGLITTAVIWLAWVVRDWGRFPGYVIFLRLVGGAILLLVAWKVRPHLGKIEKSAVKREEAGELGLTPLFTLTDRIANELNSPHIRAIRITSGYTAGISNEGWKRELALTLGLPLLVSLERQELVGLISHEMAHRVNGDPQRLWLIGSAIHSLMEWADLFFINRVIIVSRGLAGIFAFLYQIIMRALSVFAWLFGFMMAMLLYPNMQRAEYRADGFAARLSGTDSILSLLRKLYLRQSTDNIYLKAKHNPDTRIIQEISERMCNVPEREWLRIQRMIDKGESYLEDTHPTTRNRMAFLRSRPREIGQLSLSMAEFNQIMEGVRGFDQVVEAQIYAAIQYQN